MFNQFIDKATGERIVAMEFDPQHIDGFVLGLLRVTTRIEIVIAYNERYAKVSFPFGKTKELLIIPGDYIIAGEEIPGTIPKMNEFFVMHNQEFIKKFMPLDVKAQPSRT